MHMQGEERSKRNVQLMGTQLDSYQAIQTDLTSKRRRENILLSHVSKVKKYLMANKYVDRVVQTGRIPVIPGCL